MKEAFLNILKLVAFVLLIPLIVAVSISFYRHIYALGAPFGYSFLAGVLAYMVVHIFVFQPMSIFQFGQNLVATIFRFHLLVARSCQLIFSLYTIILVVLFYFGQRFFLWEERILSFLMGFVGFSYAMHVVLVAQELRETDLSALRPHYFLVVGLTYVVNLIGVGVMLSLVLPAFNLAGFFQTSGSLATQIYTVCLKQLFVP